MATAGGMLALCFRGDEDGARENGFNYRKAMIQQDTSLGYSSEGKHGQIELERVVELI